MANLGENFYPKLVQISKELGMNPEDLLAVMTSESGINPSAYESKFHGSGLLGFMPDTLKGLGFKGNWNDFINLTGAQQLDYVKKLVQNNMAVNGGKPFASAAQYYVANLWPIALKLSGIQEGDPNTAFIEENPETITDPKTGKQYSKKYYELGYRISPAYERAAYKANPLFHGSTQGAITYGDMMKQVEKNKANPIYQKALAQMQQQTGYTAQPITETNAPNDETAQVESILSQFMSSLSHKQFNFKKFCRKKMPTNKFLIKVETNNFWTSMEFSRILCLAFEEELNARASIFTDLKNIDIECIVNTDPQISYNLINNLCSKISNMFKNSLIKTSNIEIYTNIIANTNSNYQECSIKLAEVSYDVFHRTLDK